MNYRLQKTKSKVAKLLASINMELSKFELESDSIEGINSNIQKLEDSHDKMFKEIREMQRKETILEERIKNLRERDIPREEKRIRDSREKIDDIVEKSGVKLLSAYKERLSTKRVCDISINKSASILESHFKKPSGVLSENVDYWNQEISKLENYKNKGQDIDYDESVVEKFKSERIEANAKLGSWTDAMKSFQRELEEIENRVQRCLDLVADHVPCRTTLDLEPSRSRLESFVKESENSRENVLGVVKILDEINNKEQEKVLELFGEQSSITEYYRDITDGLYEEVVFNRQEKIQVKRRDGKLIEASKLSGGAYDQLYFSIRLALGNKILKGDPGFFIVDDPFIKADPERLGRQMDMLKKICAQRWQIIYFSAKGEVKDILADDIAKGAVNLVAIDNVYV
jgi:DNA repair exonuclease SbcCD ATPase subunit